ncbi:MAG: hypothetical protein H7308_08095, partial [Chthonomonadaceae bacterium]|nr:hypothetical protein [Chthonomonadaceae bacterium]
MSEDKTEGETEKGVLLETCPEEVETPEVLLLSEGVSASVRIPGANDVLESRE